MCYAKPGPRCPGHAAVQVSTATAKYRQAAANLQEAAGELDTLRRSGASNEAIVKQQDRIHAAQLRMYEAKHLLRLRQRAYDMTPEGRDKLAAKAYAAYKAGRLQDHERFSRTIDKYKAEYDLRLRDFHERYGADPNKRRQGRPSADDERPEGSFEPTVGWETYEQQENELQHDVIRMMAAMDVDRANGDVTRLDRGARALLTYIGVLDEDPSDRAPLRHQPEDLPWSRTDQSKDKDRATLKSAVMAAALSMPEPPRERVPA